jgi:hypothetical protein
MMTDLGTYSIADIDASQPEAAYLATYRPPKLEKAIREEYQNLQNRKIDGLVYNRSVPAIDGHGYLLRAISFDEADIFVAFTVIRTDSDGSVVIAWKKIADFSKPIMLYQSDEELKTAIDKITDERKLNAMVWAVKDNVLIIRGHPKADELNLLLVALREKNLRVRGEDYSQRDGLK